MSTMASQITSLTIVCSIVYSGADQRKHQSSALLAFVWGIHRWIPSRKASNAENDSIWWRHHDPWPLATSRSRTALDNLQRTLAADLMDTGGSRFTLRFVVYCVGINLCMRPVNERRRSNVTSSLIGWFCLYLNVLTINIFISRPVMRVFTVLFTCNRCALYHCTTAAVELTIYTRCLGNLHRLRINDYAISFRYQFNRLTLCGRNRMADILHTTFSIAFSWKGSFLCLIQILLNFVTKGPVDSESVLVQTGMYINSSPPVPHICVSELGQHWFRLWLVAFSAPSHCLNLCWLIVNCTNGNKIRWNSNRNSVIFIGENAFEIVVCQNGGHFVQGKMS